MDDLISRQSAIDAFYKHPNINWTTLDVLAKINALPSAQKKGKWIIQDGAVCCSECGEPNMEWNFCPNCGADMRKEVERSKLKPCPFCGHEAIVDDCGEHRYFVKCSHCCINQDKLFAQKCDAIRAWNKRVEDGEIH